MIISLALSVPPTTVPTTNTRWPCASVVAPCFLALTITLLPVRFQVHVVPSAALTTTDPVPVVWTAPLSNATVLVPVLVLKVTSPYSPPSRTRRPNTNSPPRWYSRIHASRVALAAAWRPLLASRLATARHLRAPASSDFSDLTAAPFRPDMVTAPIVAALAWLPNPKIDRNVTAWPAALAS